MRDFRLGSILGFEIRIDISWFIIFFLILWTFTFAVFPVNFPGLSMMAYIAMGVIGTLLFFASLLAHEISHSLVARAKDIPVEGITLFIFGGMSRTRMEAETAGDEFQIAGVGPLTSLVLGGLFWAVAWVSFRAGGSMAIIGVAQYLALLNVLLAVFNLLPGFPLDGGRIFRAAVWKYSGDYTKATRWASNAGKGLAYLLIGFGLFSAFSGNIVGGLWLVFIGWFLRNAAVASYQQHLLQQVLTEVRAEDAMTRDPETVRPELTLQELVDEHFMRRRFDAFPVARNGQPLGLITLEQVREVPREEWPTRTVGDAMSPAEDGVTVRPDERMSDVLQKMEGAGHGRVLVTRDGHLEGIITTADVMGWVKRARELEG